jgi:rubrerythrin
MQATTLTEAIQEAISKEKEDIGLYQSLISLVPSDRPEMREALSGILDHEIQHIKILRGLLPQG